MNIYQRLANIEASLPKGHYRPYEGLTIAELRQVVAIADHPTNYGLEGNDQLDTADGIRALLAEASDKGILAGLEV